MNSNTERIEEANEHIQHFKFTEAEKDFRDALAEDPTAIPAKVGLARILLLKKAPSDAIEILNQVLETHPANAEAIALKAIVFMMQRDWANAVSLLEIARQYNPDLPMVHINLAHCYRSQEELQKAESAAWTAVELAPENYQSHVELGRTLLKSKKNREALAQFREALRLNPFAVNGYLALARIYDAAGKPATAIKILKQGIKRNPMAITLRESIAASFILNRQPQKAFRETVIVALLRDTKEDWLKVGVAAVAAGKPDKAMKAFQKVLDQDPFSWEANYNLAEIYFAGKRYARARDFYELSIMNGESDYRPCNGLGLLLLTAGRNPKQARDCFALALQRDATRKEPMLNLALACAALNDHAAAEKYARAASVLSRPGDGTYEQAERLIAGLPRLQ